MGVFDAGSILAHLRLDKSGFTSGMLSAQSIATAFGPTVTAFMANPLLGAVQAGKKLFGLFRAQEQSEAKLEAVLKATGNAAGFTGEQLKGMASDLQSVTTVGDETIIGAQAVLATFKEIKGDNFRDAMTAAMDMNAVVGGDLQGNVMQLGKALNDPVAGISALTRVGVSFTEQQKQQIKTMAASGDVMGAQKLILAELNSEFGGAAEAIGATDTGKLERLANIFGDIGEKIFGALLPALTAAMPILELVAEILGVIAEAAGAVLGVVGQVAGGITEAIFGGGAPGGASAAAPTVNVTVDPQASARQVADQLAPVIAGGVRGVQHRVQGSTVDRMSLHDYENGLVLT